MRDDELLSALGETLRPTGGPVAPSPERIGAIRRLAHESGGREYDQLPGLTQGADIRSSVPRWRIAATAAIAFLLGLSAAILADISLRSDGGELEYAGSMDGTGGQADLRIVQTGIGRVLTLSTNQLAVLPTGEYYEVWFVATDDSTNAPNRISAGTFHPDADGNSNVVFAAAVDPSLYPIVEITSEPGDGDPSATGPVVLRADLPSTGE